MNDFFEADEVFIHYMLLLTIQVLQLQYKFCVYLHNYLVAVS